MPAAGPGYAHRMADDRVRGALLAGLALAATAVGAWWWQASAPVLGPAPGAGPSPSTSAFLERGVRVAVDPQTGQLRGEADPDAGVVFRLEPDAGVAFPPGPDGAVERTETVWQEQSHLDPGDGPLVRQSNPAPGERQLLTISCTGSGTVTVHFLGSDEAGPLTATCAAVTVHSLTASGGPLLVRFTVAGGGVDLNARLAAVV